MGSSNSTPRTFTIDNDSPVGVIDVSDAVVQRLKGGLAKAKRIEKSIIDEEKNKKSASSDEQPLPPSSSLPQPPKTVVVHQPPPPQTSYYSNHQSIITNNDILREKDIELENIDKFWREKISNLEKTYKKSSILLEDEYNKTIQEVKSQFDTKKHINKTKQEQELKETLIKCYQDNPREPLKCSDYVNGFINYYGGGGQTTTSTTTTTTAAAVKAN